MTQTKKNKREPLFRIVKRDDISLGKKAFIYAIALIGGLVFGAVLCDIFSANSNFLQFFESIFSDAFNSSRKIWIFFLDTALLLGVSLALVPAFKMKFWNLGGNGQVLMGCLATVACMHYLGGKLPDGVVNLFMIVASILAGAIWAVIPAIFKAFFNTNESLFTLMMNYIATGLVSVFIKIWVKNNSGTQSPIPYAHLPQILNDKFLAILVLFVICLLMYVYLKYSKQGYEISVVGESQNTAKYIGINVKKVIIRTLILSGAICGIVGLFIGGSISFAINNENPALNMGFTGIMTAWLANFNPLMMILSCGFITFISSGMVQVRKDFKFTNDAIANIVIGVIYFCVIACYFFITYKIVFRKNTGKEHGR